MLGYIGTYTARLELTWGVDSLKEKRAAIKPVTERLKARFPVSVARLDGLEAYDWEVIGAVTLSHDPEWVETTLQRVAEFVASHGEYRVAWERLEVLPLEEEDEA